MHLVRASRLFPVHLRSGIVDAVEEDVRRSISARRPAFRTVLIAMASSFGLFTPATGAAQQGSACRPSGPLVQVRPLSEASGLAASRRVPGRLWAHNDSGSPVLYSLDTRGAVTGQLRLDGARVEDWEAIAVGPCASGSCLYVGDIGDNEANRKRITIYRVPEPQTPSGTVAVSEVFHAAYPDGAHDAEALLVAGDGRIHIVTKGETGPVALYRFPAQLQPGTTAKLERVGQATAERGSESRITDGSVSSDGQWAVLRTRSELTFYRAADLLSGQWKAASKVDVTSLKEMQGEGVALGADNVVFLVGEGGGKGQAGTFAHFSCAPGR
jgi:hypothetical protein